MMNERYDYYEAVKNDVVEWVKNNEALEELAHEVCVSELLGKIDGDRVDSVKAIETITGEAVDGLTDWYELADEARELVSEADTETLKDWVEELNEAA